LIVDREDSFLSRDINFCLISSFDIRFYLPILMYQVRIPVHSSRSTPPSSSCGSGIYHVAGATERLCRHPKKPSAASNP